VRFGEKGSLHLTSHSVFGGRFGLSPAFTCAHANEHQKFAANFTQRLADAAAEPDSPGPMSLQIELFRAEQIGPTVSVVFQYMLVIHILEEAQYSSHRPAIARPPTRQVETDLEVYEVRLVIIPDNNILAFAEVNVSKVASMHIVD
jgi:hypothetical protein